MEKANGFSELGSLGSGRAGIWFAVRLQGPHSVPSTMPHPLPGQHYSSGGTSTGQ